MINILISVSIFLSAFFISAPTVFAHGEIDITQIGLHEGDIVRASDVADPDIFIINQQGYKRLFLSPAIFGLYAHLRWDNVKAIPKALLDAMPTSGLFRNCEINDYKVHALATTGEDEASLHWVNVSGDNAAEADDDFFEKVFCINTREFQRYISASAYSSLSQIPSYSRTSVLPGGVNLTTMPLVLPDGYSISLFTPQAVGPLRFMAFSPDGILFVSMSSSAGLYSSQSQDDGKIFAIPDKNKDGVADQATAVLTNLHLPHGIAFYNNYLYVAEEGKVVRYAYLGDSNLGAREVIVTDLPTAGEHLSRTIGFSPSGKMYISMGSSCNVCEQSNSHFATVREYNADGTGGRVFATGLRNTVGFTFNPSTAEIWGTDNGRDYLGDNLPPDEINIIKDGGNYGWPNCYGKNIHDTDFDKNIYILLYPPLPCGDKEPSLFDLQAHSAALGLRFITAQFSSLWQGDLLVAYHGSWNRSQYTGYKVVRLDVEGNSVIGEYDFISGWLRPDASRLGRPVDVIFDSDGVLYISDDRANVIYRVSKINPV